MPGATAGVDIPYSAPSWPDANMIARMANAFFQSPPNQPISSPSSPGVLVAPPSPAMVPAPSVVTTVAPFAPASPGMGPPNVPPTTIPSYVPTPNISVPLISHPPAGPLGLSDLPQPGASQESFNPVGISPSGQKAADLTQMPYRQEAPFSPASQQPDALASPLNASFSGPGDGAHVPSAIPYFLADMPAGLVSPGQPAWTGAPDLPRDLRAATGPDGAALAPAAPGEGVPDVSMTTVPSYVPTPPAQTQGALPSSGEIGALGLPQPGASVSSYGPAAIDPSGRTASDQVVQSGGGQASSSPPPQSPAALSANPHVPSVQPAGATGGFGAAETGSPAARAHPTNGSVSRAPQSLNQSVSGTDSASSFLEGVAIPVHADALYFLGESLAGRAPSQAQPRWPADLKLLPINVRPENVPDLGPHFHPFDPHFVRRDFPILQEQVNGRPLVWLDNAATTQKPQVVIDRLAYFYAHENSNVHRGAHTLAARATDAYESARAKVQRFLGAASPNEIVFVRGTTEAINLVAQAWGRRNVQKDDEVVITWLEHHANIVPWQLLCAEKGARLRVAPIDDDGQVILDEYEKLLGPRTRIVAVSQVSNALGTVTPVSEMVKMAHRHGALALVDGAQAVSHMAVDVQALDCDFYVFSGHKIFAPTGIGALYGKSDLLNSMPPWQGGGSMISDVTFEKTTYQDAPARFEAGTGSIGDAVGLGAALDYVSGIGMGTISQYEHGLLVYATERMLTVPGLRLIGTAKEKASVLSFVLDEWCAEDVGQALNQEGIAVRAGHHCAQPAHRRFGLEASVRPSLAFYNTVDDVDALVAALLRLQSGRRHRGL
jgi:cysteine desulfurase/selenocysteine lyase